METRRNRRSSPAILVLVATAVLASGAGIARDETTAEPGRATALRALELKRFEAQVSADAKVLGELLADDLEYVHSNGELDSKKSFIDSLITGKRDYTATAATIESIRFLGGVAIIRGNAKVTVVDAGVSRDLHIGFTDVWVDKGGRWQMTAWRSARLPDSPVK